VIFVTRIAASPGGVCRRWARRGGNGFGRHPAIDELDAGGKAGRVNPPPVMPAVKRRAVGPRAYRPSTPPDRDCSATFRPLTYWQAGGRPARPGPPPRRCGTRCRAPASR